MQTAFSRPGPPRRRGSSLARSAALIAGIALLSSALVSPAIGRSPDGGAAVDGMSTARRAVDRGPAGRSIGRGTRVDVRAAARAASSVPRPFRDHQRLDPKVRAVGSPKAGTRAALRITSGVASLGPTLRIPTQPAPVVTTSFAGLTEAEACGCEPPDPWIAVSPTHVVQSTNGMVRISNRAGATLVSMPTWALFAVPGDRGDADPRILWDAVHGRWVGVIMTFTGDFSANSLQLATSETADPTGAWIVYPIEFGNHLPDYPGISTSGTRIVLTSNDFLDGVSAQFEGPTWLMVDWANILAGTDLFVGGQSYADTSFANLRPAITLSGVTNTPVIYEYLGDPWYLELGGTAKAPTVLVDTDLTGLGAASFSTPPDPVQPGAVAIDQAVDERPTDAVYRSGALWFVATGLHNDGLDDWAKARFTRVLTSANGTGPSAATDYEISGSAHYFQPGVGINAAGSAIIATSVTDPVSIHPTTVIGGVMADGSIPPLADIGTSKVAYTGTRWGDYVGIAADPSGAGAVWLAHQTAADDGSWRTTVARIVSDGVAPGAPGAVSQVQVIPSTLGSTVPVRTSWGAATDAGSGVASYLVERSDDGGPFVGLKTPGTSITAALRINHSYRYRISAVDAVGNVGPPTYGPTYRPRLYQSTSSTTVTGTWRTASSASYSGGSTRYASTAGASATFTATLARSIAIVTTKAASRGSFKVYVDNVYKGTISTYSATTKFRQRVYQFSWSTAGTHKVRIVVVGTARRPRVDLDAFVVLR